MRNTIRVMHILAVSLPVLCCGVLAATVALAVVGEAKPQTDLETAAKTAMENRAKEGTPTVPEYLLKKVEPPRQQFDSKDISVAFVDSSICCPGGCGGPMNGVCVRNGTCECYSGWSGPDCLFPTNRTAPYTAVLYQDPHGYTWGKFTISTISVTGVFWLIKSPRLQVIAQFSPWCGGAAAISGLLIIFDGLQVVVQPASASSLLLTTPDGKTATLSATDLSRSSVFRTGNIDVSVYEVAFQILAGDVAVIMLSLDNKSSCGTIFFDAAFQISDRLFGTVSGILGTVARLLMVPSDMWYRVGVPPANPADAGALNSFATSFSTGMKSITDSTAILPEGLDLLSGWIPNDAKCCPLGSWGKDCLFSVCPENCGGHGTCIVDPATGQGQCQCDPGWDENDHCRRCLRSRMPPDCTDPVRSNIVFGSGSCWATQRNMSTATIDTVLINHEPFSVPVSDLIHDHSIIQIPKLCRPADIRGSVPAKGNATLTFSCLNAPDFFAAEIGNSTTFARLTDDSCGTPRCSSRAAINAANIAYRCCDYDVLASISHCVVGMQMSDPTDIPVAALRVTVDVGEITGTSPKVSNIYPGDTYFVMNTSFIWDGTNHQSVMANGIRRASSSSKDPICWEWGCSIPHSYGGNCSNTCSCQWNGTEYCNEGRSGNGSCVCHPGFAGSQCSKRCLPLQHPCNGHGQCVDDPSSHGSGKCICNTPSLGPNPALCQCLMNSLLLQSTQTCWQPDPTFEGGIIVTFPFNNTCSYAGIASVPFGNKWYNVDPAGAPTSATYRTQFPVEIWSGINFAVIAFTPNATGVPASVEYAVGDSQSVFVPSQYRQLPECQQAQLPLAVKRSQDAGFTISLGWDDDAVVPVGHSARWTETSVDAGGVRSSSVLATRLPGDPIALTVPPLDGDPCLTVEVELQLSNAATNGVFYVGRASLQKGLGPAVPPSASLTTKIGFFLLFVSFALVLTL